MEKNLILSLFILIFLLISFILMSDFKKDKFENVYICVTTFL